MLQELGIGSVSDINSDIPKELVLTRALDVPGPLSEFETLNIISGILSKNFTNKDISILLGGVVWSHFILTAVDEIVSRSEFLTSYTPYQLEFSQGLLKVLFEYQSLSPKKYFYKQN